MITLKELCIDHLTPSICNEIATCPEKAYLNYALHVEQDRSLGAVIGSAVHTAIETALGYVAKGELVDVKTILETANKEVLTVIQEENIDISDLYMPVEEQLKQLEHCVVGYLNSPQFGSLQPQNEFDNIEHFFQYFIKPIANDRLDFAIAPIDDDYIKLSGKTDFLEWNEDQGLLRIIDYKTGSSRFPWDMLKVRKRIQFRVYAWVLSKAFDVKSVDLVAHIINKSAGKKAQPVAIQEFATTFGERDILDIERQIVGFYHIVKNNIHFYCDNCPAYCSYKNICGKQIEVRDDVEEGDDLDWVV
jgi:hypothetical protein